jgi:hypothetical protein
MTEAGGKTVRCFSAKLTVQNGGTSNYKEIVCSDSLHILSTIEIYDANDILIFQDDHRLFLEGAAPYILEIRSGEEKTDQVDFWPDMYFGPLPPGRYSLRVCLPLLKSEFIASNLLPFTVPDFPQGSEYRE